MRPDQPATQETRIRLPRQDTTRMSRALAPHLYRPPHHMTTRPSRLMTARPTRLMCTRPSRPKILWPPRLMTPRPRAFTSGRALNTENSEFKFGNSHTVDGPRRHDFTALAPHDYPAPAPHDCAALAPPARARYANNSEFKFQVWNTRPKSKNSKFFVPVDGSQQNFVCSSPAGTHRTFFWIYY
jgi:hypothetical protein